MKEVRACSRAGPGEHPLTLAEVLRAAIGVKAPRLSAHQWKILNALMVCRTLVLGGHRYHCQSCGRDHFVPRSCGNRHCPNCQHHQAGQWLEREQRLLLPTPYFHVVFTLPHELNPLIEQNQRTLYNLLFSCASATLLEFGRNQGIALGLTAVLHTWSQTLLGHYHLHGIVTGGGMALDGSGWKEGNAKFLFPVFALSRVFRGKFTEQLRSLYGRGKLQFHGQLQELARGVNFQALIRKATAKSWNVYVKKPFSGPEQVLRYLSRYTHRVALSHRRLLHLDRQAQTIRFTYRIRRGEAAPEPRAMTLGLEEFLRRFALHLLPARFVKIRHYGLLSNRDRRKRLEQIRSLFAGNPTVSPSPSPEPDANREPEGSQTPSSQSRVCPFCGRRALVLVRTVPAFARTVWFATGIPP